MSIAFVINQPLHDGADRAYDGRHSWLTEVFRVSPEIASGDKLR